MKYFIFGIIFVLVLIYVFYRGWVVAHMTVAHECKTLGKFYVGKEIFECVKISEGKDDE
ncbi:hypothetical protein MMG00_12750 [Ignatzschineria rhizosphaerae]|uniref:Uncharacterized protein n=1 Tax=Ignatzschineria rhizosphaerae TaxID=2923279 RepID=A0ABY3X171_9GAMM|nr:hypothetical protein [Ignatzschineria rhizosphaerae]UNM96050.1 hypothetical protein MMG00_12750 [Ignatzschineria rhizosphaerae]